MNKLERKILKKLHFIKRIKLLKDMFYSNSFCGLRGGCKSQMEFANWTNLVSNSDFNIYRTTGTPCTDKLWQLRYDKKDRVSWKNELCKDSHLI